MSKRSLGVRFFVLLTIAVLVFMTAGLQAQETTGGLQGTVKDANGAVVPKASVELTGSSLVGGAKKLITDATGYYRFANLPPGNYTVTVKAPGFATLKREGIDIEVGHLPTLDLSLKVGAAETVVEVTEEAPLIDVAVTHTSTNVTEEVIAEVPHGRSFQSVIQFAPSARNEPLAGGNGGTGGSMPGSSANGGGVGFSVGGAADSENQYLVEGQDTSNISGGYSKANVPFEFIQEVQVKSSGIEAEHGGALGGVVNVVMKKGSNNWHGGMFSSYESSGTDNISALSLPAGIPYSFSRYMRYNPNSGVCGPNSTPACAAPGIDGSTQFYPFKQDHFRIMQAGGFVGGAIVKDRLWFFAGFAPQFNTTGRTVNFGANDNNAGVQRFNQSQDTYYGTMRVDASLTQKIRVFGSWLSQSASETGENLPIPDARNGFFNTSTGTPLGDYANGLSWSAPNQTVNTGADITITPKIVSTTRFGYFFENYHDNGWPTSGADYAWQAVGLTDLGINNQSGPLTPQSSGYSTSIYTGSFTKFNSNKHYQFDEDVALFKSGWLGTHNFKGGYQFNKLENSMSQNGNVPFVLMYNNPATGYTAGTSTGQANCAALEATTGNSICAGNAGFLIVQDFATVGKATDNNHAFFAQDAWTIGKGLTINVGIRVEKESMPTPSGEVNLSNHRINFSWSDKVEPRIGAAWDVFHNGKMKVFGSFGITNDIMKLLVAETSWGGQAYEQCSYAINTTFDPRTTFPTFVNGRACPNGASSTQATWSPAPGAADATFIENVNYRPWEPVAPSVKPYRQHESVMGVDYEIAKGWAFEARWDRHRLDHVIEDASLSDPNWFELYAITNPGEGVNKTLNGYASFLQGLGQTFGVPGMQFNGSGTFGTCTGCPNNPKAIRDYDGIEFRLTKSQTKHLSGMVAYTWSRLWGNYTGLTTTDQNDGGTTGRNSPDTTRAFDEPFYYFKYNGQPISGPLPTDRPSTFKGYLYYTQPWGKKQSTTLGLFQVIYQGSPVSTYADIGDAQSSMPLEGTYVVGHGNWINASTDANGNITVNSITSKRTPWYSQSDLNFKHEVKVNRDNEKQTVAFEATFSNIFNQQKIVSYVETLNAIPASTPLYPGGQNIFGGAAAYQAYETGYNLQQTITNSGVVKSNQYGVPNQWQIPRTIRMKLSYSF
jgi:hypothetical protein